jgi:outer membrane protein OmpA-like peptidoglycan-associated protein
MGSVLCFNRRLSRVGVLAGVLCVAGCVVEQPQPTVPPPAVIPPPSPLPPSLPPPGPIPAPKVYSGSYPDRLEAAAHDMFTGTAIRVQRNANTIKLIIPANVAFAANSAQLQSRFSVVLDSVIRLGRDYNKTAMTVKGFTDSTGSFEHNQQLSQQRAQSVGAYLSREIAMTRIRTVGYGPRYPVADNKTDVGRMQNRRIEIDMVVLP